MDSAHSCNSWLMYSEFNVNFFFFCEQKFFLEFLQIMDSAHSSNSWLIYSELNVNFFIFVKKKVINI